MLLLSLNNSYYYHYYYYFTISFIYPLTYLVIYLHSSSAISNSEGTGQKLQDNAIFEIARLRDSEITQGENSR